MPRLLLLPRLPLLPPPSLPPRLSPPALQWEVPIADCCSTTGTEGGWCRREWWPRPLSRNATTRASYVKILLVLLVKPFYKKYHLTNNMNRSRANRTSCQHVKDISSPLLLFITTCTQHAVFSSGLAARSQHCRMSTHGVVCGLREGRRVEKVLGRRNLVIRIQLPGRGS